MHGYCLKLSLFGSFHLHIDIMTLELCLCSANFLLRVLCLQKVRVILKFTDGFSVCVQDSYCCLLLTDFERLGFISLNYEYMQSVVFNAGMKCGMASVC